ncbi:hypothetical protein [Streptomyces sp. NPDC000229]|uniref:hypothetical protein n=1 Tax=Streptomyces sp. NPDC000229 TaxID=3154247 RepID=UPI003318F180
MRGRAEADAFLPTITLLTGRAVRTRRRRLVRTVTVGALAAQAVTTALDVGRSAEPGAYGMAYVPSSCA